MPYISAIDRARSALESGARVPVGGLSSVVADSWQRCRELGLDPRAKPMGNVIPFSDVSRRRERSERLRQLALAEMQMLYSQIAGSNFMIALGDADGVVLDTISDRHFADSEAGRSIIPGSTWQESERGTNALGLAATAHKPVAIYGREHYFACHGHLSCMAAPILNSRGETLGVLDASCSHEARQEHTHALVRMAAAQIENGLIYQECSDSFILAFHPRIEYLDTMSAGLLSVDTSGQIISINRPGKALLSGLSPAIGSDFSALFKARFGETVDGLLRGGVIRIRDRAGSGLFMVCRQIGQRRAGVAASPQASTRQALRLPAVRTSGYEPDFVCSDPALKAAVRDVGEATQLGMPIHITGETGTGKELMARHVHKASGRSGEFVAVNCGALPENLFIAEIFGHEKGAFTNARDEGAPGLARSADRGTLFLDEVADIPVAAQTSLLRFLDSMEVRAIGGTKTVKVDVQIVSATNRNLKAMVDSREFRADLYYRLNAFTVPLPPLRMRSDFSEIVRHLMQSIAPDQAITDAVIAVLARQNWPGNIRELKTALQRAVLRGDPLAFVNEGTFECRQMPDGGGAEFCDHCRDHPLNQQRCRHIRATFATNSGNVSRTARELNLSRTTVYKHVR